MMGPYDKERVANTTDPIEFWGFHLSPNTGVEIKAFNPTAKKWEPLGKTTSASWSFQAMDGNSVYYWNKNLVIPPSYWEKGIIGKKTRVRSESGDYQFMSVEEDGGSCYWQSTDLIDFYYDCSAPQSPVARVFTSDYVGVDAGCTDDAVELIGLVNAYRAQHGLPAVPLSPSLCAVGHAHAVDLATHHPDAGNCNMHSWSNQGPWSSCCYTDDHAKASCMWNKPSELTTYTGTGYENAATATTAAGALSLWKGSAVHNNVILNKGKWASHTWKAIGAGLHKGYAVLWFGDDPDPAAP